MRAVSGPPAVSVCAKKYCGVRDVRVFRGPLRTQKQNLIVSHFTITHRDETTVRTQSAIQNLPLSQIH